MLLFRKKLARPTFSYQKYNSLHIWRLLPAFLTPHILHGQFSRTNILRTVLWELVHGSVTLTPGDPVNRCADLAYFYFKWRHSFHLADPPYSFHVISRIYGQRQGDVHWKVLCNTKKCLPIRGTLNKQHCIYSMESGLPLKSGIAVYILIWPDVLSEWKNKIAEWYALHVATFV